MVTNNSLNQRSEALVVGPIGVASPDPNTFLLQVEKDQAAGTAVLTRNNNADGAAGYIANTDGGGSVLSCGFYQYGTTEQGTYNPTNGSAWVFSNANATGLYITCQNGDMTFTSGNTGVGNLTTTMIHNPTGGRYKGYLTNTSPAAGFIGELVSASATTGALTSLVTVNVTSISLTAGQWDISGHVQFNTTGAVTGSTDWYLAISTVTASLVNLVGEMGNTETGGFAPVNAYNPVDVRVGTTRASLSGTTTIYLNARGGSTITFTNVTATGIIRAVRVG